MHRLYCAMDTGRIQALLVTTPTSEVVYERFYERMSEQEKAELRASLSEAAEVGSIEQPSALEATTRYR